MSRNFLLDVLASRQQNALSECFAPVPLRRNALSHDAIRSALAIAVSRSMQRVRNIANTSGHRCSCPSHGHHWMLGSRQNFPVFCSVHNCCGRAEVGGHVQKVGSFDESWYIVPICKQCNASTEDLVLSPLTPLVPANVAQTCGR